MAFTTDSKVGVLLENPDTKAVLDKHLPDFSPNPLVRAAHNIALKQVLAYSGNVTPNQLAAIDADLALCKKTFSADTNVGELLAEPKAKAILDKHIPEFSPNPLVRAMHDMPLTSVLGYSGGTITPERIAAINADLAKL
jgi:para-nitrobenzyl esterase